MSSDSSYVIRASGATDALTVNQNGNTSISGNLDVGPSQAQSSIKACVNHNGKTGYVEMVARWSSQGLFVILKLIIQQVSYSLLLKEIKCICI